MVLGNVFQDTSRALRFESVGVPFAGTAFDLLREKNFFAVSPDVDRTINRDAPLDSLDELLKLLLGPLNLLGCGAAGLGGFPSTP